MAAAAQAGPGDAETGNLKKPPNVLVRGASLSFAAEVLFRDLDLNLYSGRTTCLLGPSGVGKTSLLRLVAGLAQGASGTVTDQSGRPLGDRISYMAQQDLLLPWCGVLTNTLLGARLRGEPTGGATAERARRLLAEVGLSEAAALRPGALSGGMRQRAALTRTLMEQRPLVLMDEPFSAVDAITRFELQDLSAKLLANHTVMLITHDPLEALRLAHRIHVMAGRPARLDEPLIPPGEPPRDPADPAVIALQAELLKRLSRAKEQVGERI